VSQGRVAQVVLASKNKDKLNELKKLMNRSSIQIALLTDFGKMPAVVEDGKTFEENAEKKARVYSKRLKALVLADDSGLAVRALKGEPGVYSARYAGPKCSYSDNNRKLLAKMRSVAWPKRDAVFVSVISIFRDGDKIATVRGECEGRIGFIEKGLNGFGYDPIFIPKGKNKSYAEMSGGEKNKISHRGRALRQAKAVLTRYLRKENAAAKLG
jgi:XTP/dITP diphosphohydrolase